jgi:uracil-DNA glycosylase family 4
MSTIDQRFDQLVQEVRSCDLCKRMRESSRVFGRSAGPISSDIMFIGEAPGRLGADETLIPFHGDRAGENFERLLSQVSLDRYSVFVTNSVLCNPRDEKGNNAPPSRVEMSNCSRFLRRQIELVQPKIVVTLGATALEALKAIEAHSLSINSHVRTSHIWFGRQLIPLYHPGQRALLHRSLANQLSDYQFVSEQAKRLRGRTSAPKQATRPDALAVVSEILKGRQKLSYFALHKLFFLVEYSYFRSHAKRLTGSYIIRQKDGPYCVDLHIKKLTRALVDLHVEERRGKLFLYRGGELSFDQTDQVLSVEVQNLVQSVVSSYGALDDARLKTAVYLTGAMRAMLRRERHEGVNLYNAPIPFEADAFSL